MLQTLIHSFYKKPWQFRLKVKGKELSPNWSGWIISPSPSFIETAVDGPYSTAEVEWIEINAIEQKQEGRLLNAISVSHSSEIINLLKEHAASYEAGETIIQLYLK
jgi:hypothetical protein